MTKKPGKTASDMVYSPEHHIPMGQAVKISDGEYGIRVKKNNIYETVSIGEFICWVIKTADRVK